MAADAFAQAPGKDQYLPSPPSVTGGKDPRKPSKQSTTQSDTSGSSAEDQAIDQIANDESLGAPAAASQKAKKAQREAAARKKARKKDAADDNSSSATPVALSKDDGDGGDEGALTSVGSALTDWDDPVLPGLVVLVALLTLAASVNVLMRRRRESRS